MTEQISLENIVFENARRFHENYLLKNQEYDLQEAIENYVEVLSMNPEHAQCYYRLASLMYESGQITLESTIEQCQKAIAMNPKNINAYIYAGYYLEQAENYADAEKVFKNAIKISEIKSARARFILASTLKNKINKNGFNLIDSLKYFYYLLTGGLTIFADKSALKMISKSLSDGMLFFACKTYGKLLSKLNSKNVIDFYKKSAQKTQRMDYFYDEIAQNHIKNGNIEQALDIYKKLFSINSNNKSALVTLAELTQLYYPDKVDDIIDYYTKILELEEDDLSRIYYELGHLYLKKNDKVNAVSAFKLALQDNEDNPYYNDALAYAYVQAELYDDAIEYYQRAIKINPDRVWTANVCLSLGLIYQKCKENYEASIASFQAGSILDSNNEQLLLSLGDVYSELNELDSAIKTYENAIAINPENYEAYSKLGIVLWDKGQTFEAVDAYKKALELNPEYDVTYNNLGIIYLEQIKNFKLAQECFDKAISLNPNYTLAYFNRGRLLKELGNYPEAAQNYQMAVDLNRITNVLDEQEIQKKIYELFDF